jgi:hypothetical protein
MNKKIVIFVLTIIVASADLAQAQQLKKVPRVGFLTAAPSIDSAFLGKTACEATQPARRKERNGTRTSNPRSASN